MTNNRAHELADTLYNLATDDDLEPWVKQILAFADEVRRETLREVQARIEYRIAVARGAQAKNALRDAGEYIAALERGPSDSAAPANTSGTTPLIEHGMLISHYPAGCLHPNHSARNVPPYCTHPDSACPHAKARTARTDHDWIGAALIMLIRHIPAISDRDHAFVADVKREWPDVG